MSDPIARYRTLVRAATKAKEEADRAQGAVDESMRKLKEAFDVTSLKAARKELVVLEQEVTAAEQALSTAIEQYESKWHGLEG